MNEEVKILLGDASRNFSDEQIGLALKHAVLEIETFCGIRYDKGNPWLSGRMQMLAVKMAVVKLNRLGTEGLSGESFSGVTQSYIDGYPNDIVESLKAMRRVKVL